MVAVSIVRTPTGAMPANTTASATWLLCDRTADAVQYVHGLESVKGVVDMSPCLEALRDPMSGFAMTRTKSHTPWSISTSLVESARCIALARIAKGVKLDGPCDVISLPMATCIRTAMLEGVRGAFSTLKAFEYMESIAMCVTRSVLDEVESERKSHSTGSQSKKYYTRMYALLTSLLNIFEPILMCSHKCVRLEGGLASSIHEGSAPLLASWKMASMIFNNGIGDSHRAGVERFVEHLLRFNYLSAEAFVKSPALEEHVRRRCAVLAKKEKTRPPPVFDWLIERPHLSVETCPFDADDMQSTMDLLPDADLWMDELFNDRLLSVQVEPMSTDTPFSMIDHFYKTTRGKSKRANPQSCANSLTPKRMCTVDTRNNGVRKIFTNDNC